MTLGLFHLWCFDATISLHNLFLQWFNGKDCFAAVDINWHKLTFSCAFGLIFLLQAQWMLGEKQC